MLIKVLFAIGLAIIAGGFTGSEKEVFGIPALQIYSLIGQLFLNALSLVVVPLVASSIITGMAKVGGDRSFGSLGLKTFGAFIWTALLAIATGLVVASMAVPYLLPEMQPVAVALDPRELESSVSAFQKMSQIFLKVVPSNILQAASQGQMLGLIFFCMLFGFFISKIEAKTAEIVLGFWKGIFQIMMKITHLVMKMLPIGVFGLVAKAIASTGLETMGSVAYFFGIVLAGLALYGFLLLPLWLKVSAKVNPLAHIKTMLPALVTGFSTSSSAATLPVTLECVEKGAGVSNRISSFILPLGASVNLTGSALYVCVSVLFIAHAHGISLPFSSLILVALMTLLTTLGTAGIPSGSLFSIVVILNILGLPADGIGLIMTVERLLDMFRTPVNIFGTSCCAVWVAKSEGESCDLQPQLAVDEQ